MSIDLFGNPKMEGTQKESAKVETTSFKTATTQFMQGIEGAIMPIDCIRVLPKTKIGGHYKINIKMRNPSVRPLKNGMTFRVHAYMCYNRDAWKYWKAYISQGTSGSNGLSVPCIDGYLSTGDTIDENGKITARDRSDGNTVIDSFTPNSLANCLGIPWRNYTSNIKITRSEEGKDDIVKEAYTNNRFCFRPTIIKMADRDNPDLDIEQSAELSTDEQWKDDDIDNPDLINALPFVHCQKIYRKFEMSYDLQNVSGKLNKGWYNELEEPLWITKRTTSADPYVNCINPNVEDYAGCGDGSSGGSKYSNIINDAVNHFMIFEENAPEITYINDANNRFISGSTGYDYSTVEIPHRVNDTPVISEYPYLNSLKFKQIQADYLNSGSPYPMLIRDGVEPMTEKDLTAQLYDGTSVLKKGTSLGMIEMDDGYKLAKHGTNGSQDGAFIMSKLEDGQIETLKDVLGITMQDLRKMTVLTRFKEKMSKVSQLDMYNGIIETSFGVRPEKDTHEPIYIGGFSGNLNTYAQTSTNEDFNGTTPSGEIGKGEVTIEGDIPTYFAEDHGYMIVMISNDIAQLYPRHLDRNWKTVNFQDEYFPEFNQLEPQATKKTEKTLAFTPTTTKDEEIYNYTDRYIEYKTRLSNLCGFGQSDKQIWDNYQYLTLKAEFEKGDFNVMANTQHPSMIDNKCMTVTTEPMFDYDVLRIINTVAPLPYKAKPKEL